VSFVIGTEAFYRLSEILNRVEHGERVVDVSFNRNNFEIGNFKRKLGVCAFVSIMKGCDNFVHTALSHMLGGERSVESH